MLNTNILKNKKVRLGLLALVIAVGAYFAGKYSNPAEKVIDLVKVEEEVKKRVSEERAKLEKSLREKIEREFDPITGKVIKEKIVRTEKEKAEKEAKESVEESKKVQIVYKEVVKNYPKNSFSIDFNSDGSKSIGYGRQIFFNNLYLKGSITQKEMLNFRETVYGAGIIFNY